MIVTGSCAAALSTGAADAADGAADGAALWVLLLHAARTVATMTTKVARTDAENAYVIDTWRNVWCADCALIANIQPI